MLRVKMPNVFSEIAQEQVNDSRDRHDKDWQEVQVARLDVKEAQRLADSAHAQVHDQRERHRRLSAEYAVSEEGELGRISELARDTAAATHSLLWDERQGLQQSKVLAGGPGLAGVFIAGTLIVKSLKLC